MKKSFIFALLVLLCVSFVIAEEDIFCRRVVGFGEFQEMAKAKAMEQLQMLEKYTHKKFEVIKEEFKQPHENLWLCILFIKPVELRAAIDDFSIKIARIGKTQDEAKAEALHYVKLLEEHTGKKFDVVSEEFEEIKEGLWLCILLVSPVDLEGSFSVSREDSRGWTGEQEHAVQFSGAKYDSLCDINVRIYVTDAKITGCNLTRWACGQGECSDNITSGDIYAVSANPAQVNQAWGCVDFVVRCTVMRNSATPWWVKAKLFYRLYTP